MPSDASKIALSCHPAPARFTRPWAACGAGTFQIPFSTATLGTLKSETPRPIFKLYQGKPLIALENALPTMVDEPVSRLLLHAKDPWNCNPCLSLRTARSSIELYDEFPSQIRARIWPLAG